MPSSPILAGERPSAPNTVNWKRTQMTLKVGRDWGLVPLNSADNENLSYDMTWHHNIPWADLRDSWNVIFTFCQADTVEGVIDLYGDGNGTLTPTELGTLKSKLLAIKAQQLEEHKTIQPMSFSGWKDVLNYDGAFLAKMPVSKQLDSDDADNLSLIVAWQRWNIVEGPKESVRTDDPGSDDFDDFRRVDLRKQHERFNSVYNFYQTLRSVKDSYLIANRDRPSNDSFSSKKNENVASWESQVARAVRLLDWVKEAKIVPMQKKYWTKSAAPQGRADFASLSQKQVYWVKKSVTLAQ
jgi:hypothetical protein